MDSPVQRFYKCPPEGPQDYISKGELKIITLDFKISEYLKIKLVVFSEISLLFQTF